MELKFLCEPYYKQAEDVHNMEIIPCTTYNEQDLASADAFLLGYKEDRNSDNIGCETAADTIRQQLYALHRTSKPLRIIDLGNCKKGPTVAESYNNFRLCMQELATYEKPIVIIGGTQEIVCYTTQYSFRTVSYPSAAFVDAKIDWDEDKNDFSNRNYLTRITEEFPLLRITHIANQEYLSSKDAFSWLTSNCFSSFRLGDCNAAIERSEPYTRDVQLVSFDINAIRYSDSPAGRNANGLYAEKACQIAWNAGFSPRLNTFILSEFNPQKDTDGISAQLSAEIIWHVFDGIAQRIPESIDFNDDSYLKHYVHNSVLPQDICFYESLISKMFWVEVPIGSTKKKRIIPCSSDDFELMKAGFIPDIWMTEFNRLLKIKQ